MNVSIDGGAQLTGWNMSAGLRGENMKIFSREGHLAVPWAPLPAPPTDTEPGLSWYSANFTTPDGIGPNASGLFLNATGLTRGQLYLNGEQLGRVHAPGGLT